MPTLTIPKVELQSILCTNRDKHRKLFEEALEAFREKAIENLESRIAQIKNGGKVNLYIDLVQPQDYTDSYNEVIEMLEFEINDEIELTQSEFRQYVKDDWGWKGNFSEGYTANTGKALQ